MDKIYGFKQKDVEKLIDYLGRKNERPLSRVFEEYAKDSGKSKGTVRNMYYALAKRSREDEAFAARFLGGKPIAVQAVSPFGEDEERRLVKEIVAGRKEGKSARRVINELAGSDAKKALRFQNKYRNVLKNKQGLLGEVSAELRAEGAPAESIGIKSHTRMISDVMLRRLQNEINALMERVSAKLKRENAFLRSRLGELEVENIRLKNILYGGDGGKKAEKFFSLEEKEKMLH